MRGATWLRRGYVAILLVAATVLDLLPWPGITRPLGTSLSALVLVMLFARTVRGARQLPRAARSARLLRLRLLELALSIGAGALFATKLVIWATPGGTAPDRAYHQYAVGFAVVAAARLALVQLRLRGVLVRLDLAPAQTVAAGFALAALGGGVLLSLPISVSSAEDLDLLNGLFTATSAVTVTGLAVYDPGTALTFFGQLVLLGLIQLGGLGTMAVFSSLLLLSRQRVQLKQAAALQESMDMGTVGNVRSTVLTVIAVTLALEGLGAVLLHLAWHDLPGVTAFAAVFHAVSAFCNAGFSLFARNLVPMVHLPSVNLIIAGLIVVGGIGFPVLRALARWFWARRIGVHERLPLHTRLALLTTAGLLLAGTLGLLVLDWNHSLAPHGFGVRLLAAFFQSVSARTAGFNTVDIVAMAPASLFLMMVLMFVGGSPGGTAGGIKTTTAATIFLTFRSVLRGRTRVEAYRRTLPVDQVQKALALVGVSGAIVTVGALLLLATQDAPALPLMFEAVSAFATTGLSAGVTTELGAFGKIVVMALMFIGRTGPMTLAFALQARQRAAQVEFPQERIPIG